MKIANLKKFIYLEVLTLVALMGSLDVFAVSAQSKAASKKVGEDTQGQIIERRQKMNQDAVSAVRSTQNALKALDDGNNKEALSALESATGKLELVLVKEPTLALSPVGISIKTSQSLLTVDKVKEIRQQTKVLITDGRIQEARRLLQNLVSETSINITNIPLGTYPAAIKEAARLVDKHQVEDAKTVLQGALDTLVITQIIIPIPIAHAQQLLVQAEELSKDKDTSNGDKISESLQSARSDLQLAEALGYGTKEDFSHLYKQLAELEKLTSGGKSTENIFIKVKSLVSSLYTKASTLFSKEQ